MSVFKKVFLTASQMPAFHIGLLLAVMALAGMKSVALTFLDVGAVQLFLTQTSQRAIGIDFIAVAILMAGAGWMMRLLQRRKGYGAFIQMSLLLIVLMGLIGLIEIRMAGAFDILFIAKFIYFVLINALFWSVCARFFPITVQSLKFIFILASEALGYTAAGLFIYYASIGAYGLLYYSMALFIAVLSGIYVLTRMIPVSKETFVMPTGEAQNFTERKMVRTLLMYCFATMTTFCVLNYVFYIQIVTHFQGKDILRQISLWWGLFGVVEFILAFSLIRRWFFYLLSGNIFIMTVTATLVALGILYHEYKLIFAGYLGFAVILYIYYAGFVTSLLKTLLVKGRNSINKKRMIVIEPTGLMLGGILVYYVPSLFTQAYILLGLSFLLFTLLVTCMHFYSDMLLKALKLREWRGTPLMMASKKAFEYIKNEMPLVSADEVIYFLRILELSRHPSYLKIVLKSLRHSSEKVRLFALDRICHTDDLIRYKSAVQFIFDTDKSVAVRRQALAVLIQMADLSEDEGLLDSYSIYLDDRSLRAGAMIGFLRVGGNNALLAMDGLQTMANSARISDKLLALKVMGQAPSYGLIRILMPLLKSPNPQIVNEALLVAGAIKHAESLPIILMSLDEAGLHENALVALRQFDMKAYPLIERTLHNSETGAFRQKILILYLTMQKDTESKQILLRALKIGNQKLRKAIIRGMIDTGIFWTHKGKYQLLKKGIMVDAERIMWLKTFCDKYKQAPLPAAQDAFSFLTRAMQEDINETRDLIFYQLLLLNKSKMFHKAVRVLFGGNYTDYPLALSVLQDLLRKDLYTTVEQIARLPYEQKKEVIAPKIALEEAVHEISDLLLNPPFHLAAWIRAGALYCLRKMEDAQGLPAVYVGLKSRNPLILEAAVLALIRLEEDTERLNETLLTVPTSSLVSVQLDTIIKN